MHDITDCSKFAHFISLGYFCSVALELERIGLRNESSPFDWCITTDFPGVLEAVENRFSQFLDPDQLAQSKANAAHYMCRKYHVEFYHDFDRYRSLKAQLAEVQKKYERRIDRLYRSIAEPTLFIRYINSEDLDAEGRCRELVWIEENEEKIRTLLQGFHSENDILYIGNRGLISDRIRIYTVDKDENDTVARRPLDKDPALRDLLESFDYREREKNLQRFAQKQREKAKQKKDVLLKARSALQKMLSKEYSHGEKY